MTAINDEEAVEKVAEALYISALRMPPTNPWAKSWGQSDDSLKERYRIYARDAIQAHFEAYETPYMDEDHQGGNLLELFLKVHAENVKLRGRSLQSRDRIIRGLMAELGRRQRQGQAAMNVLALTRPDLAGEIDGTDKDCWEDDSKLPALMAWLIEKSANEILANKLQERIAKDNGVRHPLDDVLAEENPDVHDEDDEEVLRDLMGDNPESHVFRPPGPGTMGY